LGIGDDLYYPLGQTLRVVPLHKVFLRQQLRNPSYAAADARHSASHGLDEGSGKALSLGRQHEKVCAIEFIPYRFTRRDHAEEMYPAGKATLFCSVFKSSPEPSLPQDSEIKANPSFTTDGHRIYEYIDPFVRLLE
jgi:hypothetical protein